MNNETETKRSWKWIGRISCAHVLMLRDIGLIDDDATAVLLKAIDTSAEGRTPSQSTALQLIAEFDERVDAISPPGYAGAGNVGRGSIDLAATVARGRLREELLALAERLHSLRGALIEMAAAHVVTLMPAQIDGQIAQPTTLGHWLGGTIGALGRASDRLHAAYQITNQSPMGSGSLASTGMSIDREQVASLLGFDGVVANTFDAVSATDYLVAIADAIHAMVAPVRRLLEEIVAWIRIEPESFLLSDEWTSLIGQLPQGRFPTGLSQLIGEGRQIEAKVTAVRSAALAPPYAPIAGALDGPFELLLTVTENGGQFFSRSTELIERGIVVNRALLANRAGKSFSTSSDLADFLMIEEQLDPGAARNIAALAISRARDQGLEAAGITVELIDGSALLVIGRELKVEFEAISRYLAPRRFVERRVATGAPSPAATRAYLELERNKLASDTAWRTEALERTRRAFSEFERMKSDATAT